MEVKATIIGHEYAGIPEDGHRFVYTIEDEFNAPRMNVISLRTARALAQAVMPATAFGQMVVQIASTEYENYDRLVTHVFTHL